MFGQDVCHHCEALHVVDQGWIVERHRLHVVEHRVCIAKLASDEAALAPDGRLKALATLAIRPMAKGAELRIDLLACRDLRRILGECGTD